MRFHTLRLALVAPALLLFAAGCSQPSGAVSGNVTLDEKTLASGYISFAPADGKGPVVGGPITAGRFDVQNVPPGPKVVTVQATVPDSDRERSSDDGYAKGKKVETVPSLQDAVGNGQKFDVSVGAQSLDVKLATTRR